MSNKFIYLDSEELLHLDQELREFYIQNKDKLNAGVYTDLRGTGGRDISSATQERRLKKLKQWAEKNDVQIEYSTKPTEVTRPLKEASKSPKELHNDRLLKEIDETTIRLKEHSVPAQELDFLKDYYKDLETSEDLSQEVKNKIDAVNKILNPMFTKSISVGESSINVGTGGLTTAESGKLKDNYVKLVNKAKFDLKTGNKEEFKKDLDTLYEQYSLVVPQHVRLSEKDFINKYAKSDKTLHEAYTEYDNWATSLEIGIYPETSIDFGGYKPQVPSSSTSSSLSQPGGNVKPIDNINVIQQTTQEGNVNPVQQGTTNLHESETTSTSIKGQVPVIEQGSLFGSEIVEASVDTGEVLGQQASNEPTEGQVESEVELGSTLTDQYSGAPPSDATDQATIAESESNEEATIRSEDDSSFSVSGVEGGPQEKKVPSVGSDTSLLANQQEALNSIKFQWKPVHKDALGIFFGNPYHPGKNWDPSLIEFRATSSEWTKPGGAESKRSYLLNQNDQIVSRYGLDIFVNKVTYGPKASITDIMRENMELLQLYLTLKGVKKSNVMNSKGDQTVEVRLKDLMGIRNSMAGSAMDYPNTPETDAATGNNGQLKDPNSLEQFMISNKAQKTAEPQGMFKNAGPKVMDQRILKEVPKPQRDLIAVGNVPAQYLKHNIGYTHEPRFLSKATAGAIIKNQLVGHGVNRVTTQRGSHNPISNYERSIGVTKAYTPPIDASTTFNASAPMKFKKQFQRNLNMSNYDQSQNQPIDKRTSLPLVRNTPVQKVN